MGRARSSACGALALAVLAGLPARAAAQDVVQALHNPFRLSGNIITTGQAYAASGIAGRWPGASYTVEMNSEATLFNAFSMGLDVLLSSQGSAVRQNMSQFGLNPSWHWITLHLGDFADDYTESTIQGTRVRGAGFDLRPGIFRISLQGGASHRAVFAGEGNAVYAQHLYAGMVGMGDESGTHLDLVFVKAKDDSMSLQPALMDTLLLDTIPLALRPQAQTRPQENLVVGAAGELMLFGSRLVLKGEGDGAVITHDLGAAPANASSVALGSLVNHVMPLKLSTSGDLAYRLQGSYSLGTAAVHAGYRYVGPGYTSLGVPYVINDRKGYDAGGNVGLLANHLFLVGELQHQNDNLLGQKVATTNQDVQTLNVSVRPTTNFTATVTGLRTVVANDAPSDTFAVNDRSYALTSTAALASHMFAKPTTFSLSYGFQQTTDVNLVVPVPTVTVQNVSGSIGVQLTKAIDVAPSVSLAQTRSGGASGQSNVFVGMHGQGKFLDGSLSAAFDASRTYASSRAVVAVSSRLTYQLPWQSSLTFQTRYNHCDALGSTPAFSESFATLSLERSF
jgi:hypothetical protein